MLSIFTTFGASRTRVTDVSSMEEAEKLFRHWHHNATHAEFERLTDTTAEAEARTLSGTRYTYAVEPAKPRKRRK